MGGGGTVGVLSGYCRGVTAARLSLNAAVWPAGGGARWSLRLWGQLARLTMATGQLRGQAITSDGETITATRLSS